MSARHSEAVRLDVMRLYHLHWTYAEIAAAVGLAVSQVTGIARRELKRGDEKG